MKYWRPSPIEWVALCVLPPSVLVLAGMNVWLVSWQPDISPSLGAASQAAPVAAFVLPPSRRAASGSKPHAYSEILARPLFHASRRPPPEVVAAPASTAPKPVVAPFPADKFVLVGIMRQPNRPARALLRTGQTGTSVWIAEGASLAGWTLKSVGDDRVEFVANGTTGVLKMASAPSVSGTSAQK